MSIYNDDFELANAMFGSPTDKNQNGSDIGDISTGTAIVDSANGTVQVNPTGSTLGDNQILTLPTWASVKTGDVVNIKVVNGSPVVVGVVGSADRIQYNTTVSVQQLAESILSEVSARQVTDGVVSDIKSKTTVLEQTSESLSLDVTNMQGAIDSNTDTSEKINKHFDFNTNGLVITNASDPNAMKMTLSNTSLNFDSKGISVLELDGSTSTAKASKFQVGHYCWTSTGNGANMSLLYVGDA
jgi:hypothetical protein